MLRRLAELIVCGVLMTGCGQTEIAPTTKSSSPDAKQEFALDDFVVGEPVRFENLTVFPVVSRTAKSEDRFITLDEGLKAGTVEIREVGSIVEQSNGEATEEEDPSQESIRQLVPQLGGNDVNSLVVVNHSDKPLYLMPGEVIIGGSQDRTIGSELVIAPNNSPTPVPVYCVENGRWGAKGVEQTLAQIQGANASSTASASVTLSLAVRQTQEEVAEQADKGRFIASIGQLGKSARLAVQSDKDQSHVWASVAATNSQSGVAPISGAFTANYTDANTIKRLEPYLEKLQSPVETQDRVVGVLVAINGKVESIDVFESTPLFKKVWPKLLKSYSLDAANTKDDSNKKWTECTRESALSFFAETLHASVASTDNEHGMGLVKRDGQHVLSFTSHIDTAAGVPADAADTAPSGGAMGGMGGGVHFSGFAK